MQCSHCTAGFPMYVSWNSSIHAKCISRPVSGIVIYFDFELANNLWCYYLTLQIPKEKMLISSIMWCAYRIIWIGRVSVSGLWIDMFEWMNVGEAFRMPSYNNKSRANGIYKLIQFIRCENECREKRATRAKHIQITMFYFSRALVRVEIEKLKYVNGRTNK